MGGMSIYNPTETCQIASANSALISQPLVRLIQRQVFEFDPRELASEMKALRAHVDVVSSGPRRNCRTSWRTTALKS